MSEERVKCPFCSELILPDAKKCRYCREWLTEKPFSSKDSSISHQVRTGPQVQKETVEDSEVYTQTENEQSAEEKDSLCTSPVEIETKESEPLIKTGKLTPALGAEDFEDNPKQEETNDLTDTSLEDGEPVSEPADEKPTGKAKSEISKKHRIACLRIILAITYVILVIGFVIYERNAHRVLHRGQNLENRQRYETAMVAYQIVVEKFSLSYAVIKAKEGLLRIEPALQDSDLPERIGTTFLEEKLGSRFSPYVMYWLPFMAWPLCAGLLFLVFITRLRRAGIAFLAILLMAMAGFGFALELTWYGLTSSHSLTDIAEGILRKSSMVFGLTYTFLIVTALMMLTATRKVKKASLKISPKEKEKLKRSN